MGFPGGLVIKNTSVNARDMSLIPGLGRSPGDGMAGNLLQFSCLENSTDRGACRLQSMGPQRVGHDLATKEQQMSIISL